MRNNNSSFYRTGDVSREPNQCSGWLNSFAEKMAVSEQAAKTFEKEESEDPKKRVKTASRATTAVEVARKRQQVGPSIYEMMSAIVSGQKPKYSSVEEAVKDYQQRTGLAQVLQSNAKKNDVVDAARQVVQAAGPTGKLNKDEPEMGEVIQFPKNEISESKVVDEVEPGLAKVLQLFRELDDNGPRDPKPHGPGTAVEATLFEVPELEEAAVDDEGLSDREQASLEAENLADKFTRIDVGALTNIERRKLIAKAKRLLVSGLLEGGSAEDMKGIISRCKEEMEGSPKDEADDDEEDADVDDTAYEGKQIRWLSDFINKTMAGKGAGKRLVGVWVIARIVNVAAMHFCKNASASA